MGHEFVGTVVEVGAEVRKFRKGDRVCCPFTSNCGQCFYCHAGHTCRCIHGQLFGWMQNGKGLQGCQAEFVRVPLADSTLYSYSSDVSELEALLAGDVLATGYFCALQAGIQPQGVYAVLGCGPVGLMAIAASGNLGAATVVAVDRVVERLAIARELGAISVNMDTDDPLQVVMRATGGRGADAVLEAVGSPSASRLAMNLVRPCGTISAVGVHVESQFAFSPVEAYDKNLTYKAGRCPARDLIPTVLRIVRELDLPLASIFTHRLPLTQGEQGYSMFDEKASGCIKVLLEP